MDWKKPVEHSERTYKIPASWLHLHYYDALNVLFRLENALRVFVYVTLKSEFRDKWTSVSISSEDGDGTIGSIASKRRNQAGAFGYLGYPVSSPLLYLNTGELTRLIGAESYWKLFKPYFKASKNIVMAKFDEINTVRNAFAHFRPIKQDDLETIKQSSKHILTDIETSLYQLIRCPDTVPTNTQAAWYKDLRAVASPQCALTFSQSIDQSWYRISVAYAMPKFHHHDFLDGFHMMSVANVVTPAILQEFPALRGMAIYVVEDVPWVRVSRDKTASFSKTISFGFTKDVLISCAIDIKTQLESLLRQIDEEASLIKEDNLARGKLVRLAYTNARFGENEDTAYAERSGLISGFTEEDPVEWWGALSPLREDFISSTQNFPWMGTSISSYSWTE